MLKYVSIGVNHRGLPILNVLLQVVGIYCLRLQTLRDYYVYKILIYRLSIDIWLFFVVIVVRFYCGKDYNKMLTA